MRKQITTCDICGEILDLYQGAAITILEFGPQTARAFKGSDKFYADVCRTCWEEMKEEFAKRLEPGSEVSHG